MWIKLLRQRKLQTALIFLIVTICTTLLTGAISILTSLEKPSKDFSKACNAATAKIYPYDITESSVYALGNQFKNLSNVKQVLYLNRHEVDESLLFNGKKVNSFFDLTVYNKDIFGKDIYVEGNSNVAEKLADDECIFPAGASNEYNVHIGDTVTVKLADGDVTYKVAAVYTDSFQTSTAFDCDILIKALPKNVKNRIIIMAYGNDGVTGAQIEEAYREKYDGQLNAEVFALETRIKNGLLVGNIIGAVFLAIGVIMLLVSGLIIHYMIKNAMVSDAKSIAVYKTIGYTSNNVMFMYLKLYFTVVTLASAVGIAFSVLVSNTVLTSIFQNMGQQQAANPFLPGLFCYLATTILIISVIVANIAKTRRVKPVLALNGLDYGGVKKAKNYKGNSRFQFSAAGIALRNFTRDKKNAVSIIITCVVTVYAANFAIISLDVANNLKQNNDFWIGVDKSDVNIGVTSKDNYNFVKGIVEKDSRVEGVLQSNLDLRVTMKWKKGIGTTSMNAFIYDDFSKANLPVTEGRNPQNGDEIAISTTVSKELNKSIGDYIEVYIGGTKKANLLITGYFQSFLQLGDMCRITKTACTEHGFDLDYDNISVYLKDKSDITSFISDMKGQIGGHGNVLERTEAYSSIMNMVATPQQKAIPPVVGLVLVIAGLNVFSIVFLKNVKSQRVNGIYKCMGYTTWHLISANLMYVMAIAVVSVAIALPVSIITYSPVVRAALVQFNFTQYPVQINILHLSLVNIIVIAAFAFCTLISSGALFKVNARDLVQE